MYLLSYVCAGRHVRGSRRLAGVQRHHLFDLRRAVYLHAAAASLPAAVRQSGTRRNARTANIHRRLLRVHVDHLRASVVTCGL